MNSPAPIHIEPEAPVAPAFIPAPPVTLLPEVPAAAPAVTLLPEVPAAAPVVTLLPEVPAAAPAVTLLPELPAAAPAVTLLPEVPAAAPAVTLLPEMPAAEGVTTPDPVKQPVTPPPPSHQESNATPSQSEVGTQTASESSDQPALPSAATPPAAPQEVTSGSAEHAAATTTTAPSSESADMPADSASSTGDGSNKSSIPLAHEGVQAIVQEVLAILPVVAEPDDDQDLATNEISNSVHKQLHEMSFKEICGSQPWLNETFRSQQGGAASAATPRLGRRRNSKMNWDWDTRAAEETEMGRRANSKASRGWAEGDSNSRDAKMWAHFRSGKIVNGDKSEYGEWPWQVSLRQWRTATFLHKCGAALLSENWAITAAHCVEGVEPDLLLLRMGEYDLDDTFPEPYPFQASNKQNCSPYCWWKPTSTKPLLFDGSY